MTRKKRQPKPAFAITLSVSQVAWVDSVIASVKSTGGPRFTRNQVLRALLDAGSMKKMDLRSVRTTQDLRLALGALDLRTVEKMLRDRPRGLESGLLKALEDSIK